MAKRKLSSSTKAKLRAKGKRRASNPRVKACIMKLRNPRFLDRLYKRYPYSQARKIFGKNLGACMVLGVRR